VLNSGFVGIGQTTPALLLHVGSPSASGAVARFQNSTGTCDVNPTATALSCSSDMALKKNIDLLSDGSAWSYDANIAADNRSVLARLLALAPVSYNWNAESDTDAKHAGFIAQDVWQVFPNLVSEDSATHLLSLNYMGLIPYTVEAIKEMDLNVTGIANLDRPNTWREALSDWLGNAANGIKSLVVHDKICINNTCVTEEQLQRVLQESEQQSSVSSSSASDPVSQPTSPVVDESDSEEEVTQTPATPPEEIAAPVVEDDTQSPEVPPPGVETPVVSEEDAQ
jgi:hypothetical protein